MVYLVQDQDQCKYAIKTIKRSFMEEIYEKAYENETWALQQCQHKNIIKLKESHPQILINTGPHSRSVHALVLEYAHLGSLEKILEKKPKGFKEKEMRRLFRKVLDAVRYIHDKKLAHRDIKVDNLVLDQDYEVKLIDFSFVCDAFERQTLKCGTLSYQAPELLNETKDYQAIWVDIFALGVTLFYLVSGQFPFFKACSTDPKYGKILKKQEAEFWELQEQDIGYGAEKMSPDLRSLIFEMLNPVPNLRPTTNQIANSKWMLRPDSTQIELEIELRIKAQSYQKFPNWTLLNNQKKTFPIKSNSYRL